MTHQDTPRAPQGLGDAGAGLWGQIVTMERQGSTISFRADELAVLDAACRTADVIERLETVNIAVLVPGSTGQIKVSPVIIELRHQRAALATLLGRLAVPDADEGWDNLTASQRARRAARARWSA